MNACNPPLPRSPAPHLHRHPHPHPQAATLSPLLWSDAELKEELTGSVVLEEARQRREALKQQWQQLAAKMEEQGGRSKYDPGEDGPSCVERGKRG